MNIYAKKGSKVIFVHPEGGYKYDQEDAQKHLVVGNIYTVSHTIVGDWSSMVFFEEIPNIAFNSVFFEDMEEKPVVVVIPKLMKEWIDNASYEDLLRKGRFAPAGDVFLQGEVGEYYAKVMAKKRDEIGFDAACQASKRIGWAE